MKLMPPVFRAGSAILSEKIDQLAEQVAAILNGGLDADNLAAGIQLPLNGFIEGRSLLSLDALLDVVALQTTSYFCVVPAGTGLRLLGWGIQQNLSIALPDLTYSIRKNGVQVESFMPSNVRAYSDTGEFSTQPTFVPNDIISVYCSAYGSLGPGPNPRARITLSFDTQLIT